MGSNPIGSVVYFFWLEFILFCFIFMWSFQITVFHVQSWFGSSGKYLFGIRIIIQWLESGCEDGWLVFQRVWYFPWTMCWWFIRNVVLAASTSFSFHVTDHSHTHWKRLVDCVCVCCCLFAWMCCEWMYVVCVCYFVNVCWFTHRHMMWSHISVGKWWYNLFWWYFISTHSLLLAAVPLRYQVTERQVLSLQDS